MRAIAAISLAIIAACCVVETVHGLLTKMTLRRSAKDYDLEAWED